MMKKAVNMIFLGFLMFTTSGLEAQQTFQKTLEYAAADVQVFDAVNTSDGGYALAGIAGTGSQEMLLVKMDACANIEWCKTYGSTSTVQNVWIRLMETTDHHIVMVNNSGSWFSNTMDVVVVKTTLDGTLVWKKEVGGSANDFGSAIIETLDGNYAIAGGTGSYGSDAGSSYEDAFVLKMTPDGDVLWSKTLGNSSAYDDAYDLVEDPSDSSLVVGGRYIVNGTFYSFLARTDAIGNLTWLRAYGRDNHANVGYAVAVDNSGDYLLAGSTTTLGADYQSYGDPFLIKVNPFTGDTVWTRVFPPSDDVFDNASALVLDDQGNYAMMVATASYSSFTVGFVPNKHALLSIDPGGNLLSARLYNHGGSHYPHLRRNLDGSLLISGFSNQYTDPCCNFQPLLIRTDLGFQSGCNETDVTNYTGEEFGIWQVETPPVTEDEGFVSTPLSGEGIFVFDSINTLCTSDSPVVASFIWDGDCPTLPVDFESTSTGIIDSFQWYFGNGMTSAAADTSVALGQTGDYMVTLIVSNTCFSDTIVQVVTVTGPTVDAGPDVSIYPGESATLGGDPTSTTGTLLWSPDEFINNPVNQNPFTDESLEATTTFYVTVTVAGGCFAVDSMVVIVLDPLAVDDEGELFIPNIFSPNGDDVNEVFAVYGGPLFNFHLTIFNRWGELVFESADQQVGWNGYLRALKAPPGMYVFKFQASNAQGNSLDRNGTFTLLR